jgi:putative ABC transport system permease protein
MLPSTIKKILADLLSSKVRSILVVLSIAVGVFAVGMIATSFSLIQKDMSADYLAANPHTARLYTSAPFNSSEAVVVLDVPDVENFEDRYSLWVKILGSNGRQYPINIDSLTSLDETKVDKVLYESGKTELKDGEIYIERQGAEGLGLKTGDTVALLLNNGQTISLKMAGSVHDVMSNPFTFTNKTSGYVTRGSMAELGGSDRSNYISIVTSGSHTDAAHIRKIAEQAVEKLADHGVIVANINISSPGQHPAQSIIDTVLLLLSALSILVIFLSAFLVTNTLSALMEQQVRQIGVMKAVGATIWQVMGLYLGLILTLGFLALAIAIPLSSLAAFGMSRWLTGMLNATPSTFALPANSLFLQLFIGLAVPVVGGLIPVLDGSRRTIREALTNYGIAAKGQSGLLDGLVEALIWLPRPLILSLRNTFQRKSRLFLTLVTLILGGAIFMSVYGVRESLYYEIDTSSRYYQSDVNVELARFYPLSELQDRLSKIPGVDTVEGWIVVNANVLHTKDGSSDQVIIYAPPPNSTLIDPVMMQGRWLEPGDKNMIIVSNHFIKLRPDVNIGDSIMIRLNEVDTPMTVAGVFRMAGTFPSPFVYMNSTSLAEILGNSGQANLLQIGTSQDDPSSQQKVLSDIQADLIHSSVEATLHTGSELINQTRSQVNILIALLLAMGLLIAVVGGLGLMGTMGMNVLERTREIGVMRSIGAQSGVILQLVVVEGLLIGLISWVFSLFMAIPITHLLDNSLGLQLLNVPITYTFSTSGALIWLVIAGSLAALSSLLPARSAVRLTIRDVLAYE